MRSITKRLHRSSTVQQHQQGLSRFQLIVAIAVLAVIAVVTVPRLINAVHHAHSPQIITVEQELAELENGLRLYQQDNGRYPTDEQGLLALILKPARAPVPTHWQTGGYVDRLPHDPWGHPYRYRLSDDGSRFDLFSFGPGGPDGDGEGVIHGKH